MQQEGLELIWVMSKLTQTGKLVWSKTDYDCYEAVAADQKFSVEFIYLARTDEVGSDRTIARLSAFQMLLDYSIGTEGMDLLCDMLALSDPKWIEHINRGRHRLLDGLRFLQGL
jgi:hypothetical protein